MKKLPVGSLGFWYRRAATMVLVSAVVAGAALGFIAVTQPHMSGTLFFTLDVAGVALAVALGILTLFLRKESALYFTSLGAYFALLGATSSGLFALPEFDHRLLLLTAWALLGFMSGIWNKLGLIGTAGVGIVLLNLLGDITEAPIIWLTLTLAFIVGPLISYIGFHRSKTPEGTDASAYNELAQELSQVANKSEIVINAIGDGVIAIDGEGIVQLINPAAQTIMGWGEKDAIDLDYRSIFKLSNAKDQPYDDTAGPVQQVLHGGESVARNDLILTTSSGKHMNISLLVSPLGKVGSGAIIVFRDITDEVSDNKQRAEFVSTASHEMRTPVAAIEGYLGLALNPNTAVIDEKAREYITKAHESAQHLGRLFQDLLDVSRAEDGRLKTNPAIIELVSFLREIVSILAPKAAEKQLTLEFIPDTNVVNKIAPIYYVEVDPDHLREVMSNLIENGIKYTKQGRVRVDISGTHDNIQISVSDTGIGIAREDIPHLFQKFYRIDNTDTREIGGTGLGLYLCRRLVEHMNGRLWVESNQGAGSTFFVELDRVLPEEVEHRQRQVKQAAGL